MEVQKMITNFSLLTLTLIFIGIALFIYLIYQIYFAEKIDERLGVPLPKHKDRMTADEILAWQKEYLEQEAEIDRFHFGNDEVKQ